MTNEQRHGQNEEMLKRTHPVLAGKIRRVLVRMEVKGWQPIIASSYRSEAEQKRIYERGDSKVLFSFHCAVRVIQGQRIPSALANDVVDCRFNWNIPQDHQYWKDLGSEGKKEGLIWGGDWHNFPDVAHLQLLQNDMLIRVQHGYVPPLEEENDMTADKAVYINGIRTKYRGALDQEQGTHLVPIAVIKETNLIGATYTYDEYSLKITLKK